MILGKHKVGGPRKWDLLLAEAEFIVESERCPQCGLLRYQCQSDDPDIAFQIRTETCNATRARAKAEKAMTKDGKKDAPVGTVLGADAYTYSKTPLEQLRVPFYEEQSKRQEALEKERPYRPRD